MSTINDAKVLNAILNPNTPFEEDQLLKETTSKYDESSVAIKAAKDLEIKALIPEELTEQHSEQKNELVLAIQALKLSVTKGDKKMKKKVDAQIEALQDELLTLENETITQHMEQKRTEKQPEITTTTTTKQQPQQKPLSKAQKKREKKEMEDKLRQEQIALQEVENLKGPAHIEITKIKEKLVASGLEISEVSSDGNCMFYAVSEQLTNKLGINKSFKELREMTSTYMLHNPDEFMPYLCSELTGDPFGAAEYEEYCLKIRECLAPVWGSMTELKALSEILKVGIEVVQAEGSEIVIGDDSNFSKRRLIVTYHRRMFGAGEHYNSTRLLRKEPDDF